MLRATCLYFILDHVFSWNIIHLSIMKIFCEDYAHMTSSYTKSVHWKSTKSNFYNFKTRKQRWLNLQGMEAETNMKWKRNDLISWNHRDRMQVCNSLLKVIVYVEHLTHSFHYLRTNHSRFSFIQTPKSSSSSIHHSKRTFLPLHVISLTVKRNNVISQQIWMVIVGIT